MATTKMTHPVPSFQEFCEPVPALPMDPATFVALRKEKLSD